VGAPPSLPRLALVMTPPALLSHLSALLLQGGLKTLCPSLSKRNDCPCSLCACAGEGADDGPCVHRQHHLPTRHRQDAHLPWLILPAMILRLLRCKAAYASPSCARTREGMTATPALPFHFTMRMAYANAVHTRTLTKVLIVKAIGVVHAVSISSRSEATIQWPLVLEAYISKQSSGCSQPPFSPFMCLLCPGDASHERHPARGVW